MSTTFVCDNTYQLYLAWALDFLGTWPDRIDTVISVGDYRLAKRATEVAEERGWCHLHRACPSSFIGQVAVSTALAVRPSESLLFVLNETRSLVVFNDTHPCTVQIRSLCSQAPVSLVEEGTGLHRSRPIGPWSSRRWLSRLFVPALNVSGRQGEAPWVDELWVTQTDCLTPAQRRKRIVTFDRTAVVAAMRRRWGTTTGLVPSDTRPVLLFLGQPFVEDRVLSRAALESMLATVSAAMPGHLVRHLSLIYKPHPRERHPKRAASRLFGDNVLILDRHAPLETIDFGDRRLFVILFTSGSVRGLSDTWRCVSVARCFPVLLAEADLTESFGGVTFLSDLRQLPGELEDFVATSTQEQARDVARGHSG